MEADILALKAQIASLEQENIYLKNKNSWLCTYLQADITGRMKSEEKFSKAFHENQIAMCISRMEDGVFLNVNDQFLQTFGYKREEIIGGSAFSLWQDTHEREEMISRVDREGSIKGFKTKFRRSSGEIVIANTSISVMELEGQKCLFISVEDITERLKTEEDLHSTQKLLVQILDNVPFSVLIASITEGKIVWANNEFLKRNRLTRAKVIGQIYDIHYDMEDPEEADQCVEAFLRYRCLIYYEMNFKAIAKGQVTILLNCIAVNWMGEECVVILSNDVTKLRRYQHELARLDCLKLMGQMAGSIAHEVRNPMTSIKGYLQLFQHQYKYQEDRDSIQLMIEEIDRINEIISAFLSMSQTNHTEMNLMDLNDCINSFLQLIIADAVKYDVFVETRFEPGPRIMIDKGEIRQLLLNLTRNAMQAMPSGGTLKIHTFEEGGGVTLIIQDNGQGIPAEIMEKIGTPFLTNKVNGSGLGFAICYSIAKKHNAHISIDTSAEGTSIKVTFPAA